MTSLHRRLVSFGMKRLLPWAFSPLARLAGFGSASFAAVLDRPLACGEAVLDAHA